MTREFSLPVEVRGAPREFHVSRNARERYELDAPLFSLHGSLMLADLEAAQRVAHKINAKRDAARFPERAVRAGDLYAAGLIDEVLHLLVAGYLERHPGFFEKALATLTDALGEAAVERTLTRFATDFPARPVYAGDRSVADYLAGETDGVPHRHVVLEELLMLWLANQNPAFERFGELFDDRALREETAYEGVIEALGGFAEGEPAAGPGGESLLALLRAPFLSNPTSLEGQLGHLRGWASFLGEGFGSLMTELLRSRDVLQEERKEGGFGGPGPSVVLSEDILRGAAYASGPEPAEYERFSPDKSWMPRVVMLAKSTYVWLDQLSKGYGRSITRLDEIPDEELDELGRRGFTGLWLIGLWERSEASKRIKHLRGNPDAVASAYSLYDYVIAPDLGGDAAYENLRDRAWARGIRLASDMVPNHMGIDSRWVVEHPDWFLSLDKPPYPAYTFNGPDLSRDARVGIFLEDHYYDSTDAAVVFKRVDRQTGSERYVYHGNDGTTIPWNDTAQLNYALAEVREAVIQTILHVARKFPIIRFDAAMTLAKKHIERLWFPQPGHGGAIPSRAQYGSMTQAEFNRLVPEEFWREVVDRVAEEVPDTLLLAEAFWMMEGFFVRTLGMHRVYNSAFMHMLRKEDNAEYRQSIKNVLEFEPEILKRFVNFMNNPDEETAIAQFGDGDKYFGVCVLMSTLPGLPMYGHGQVEGFREKYGMEYKRAKLNEAPNMGLLERHRREIFPLLHRRKEFAEVENFRLYDLVSEGGGVNEDVYAYSNRDGERVSLVVFNNKFADARGLLKASASAKGVGERSLAENLGLRAGERDFVILRDATGGLEYLRRSRDVQEGFRVELGAYQYRVFLDVREVEDNEFSHYAQLYDMLGERGVPSLEEALEDLRLRPLHEAFAGVLEPTTDETEVTDETKTPVPVRVTRYTSFLARARDYGFAGEHEVAVARFASLTEGLAGLSERAPENLDEALGYLLELTPADEAVLKARAALEPLWAEQSLIGEWRLLNALRGHLAGLGGSYDAAYRKVELVELFLNHGDVLRLQVEVEDADDLETDVGLLGTEPGPDEARTPATSATSAPFERSEEPEPAESETLADPLEAAASPATVFLTQVLETEPVPHFLQVNEHEGVRWFNREAYRDLLGMALKLELLDGPKAQEEAALWELVADLHAAEVRSGYRVDRLVMAFEDVEVEASEVEAQAAPEESPEEAVTDELLEDERLEAEV